MDLRILTEGIAHLAWAGPVLYPVAKHASLVMAEYLRSVLLLNPTPQNLLSIASKYSEATGLRYLPSLEDGVASVVPAGKEASVSLAEVRRTPELYSADEGIRTIDLLARQAEIKRDNTEKTLLMVLAEAAQDPDFPTEPTDVDETWFNRFFEWVGAISDEEVQALWAKVLAGQIKRPGSFSLRTLDVLRNLSKEEAELFRSVIKYRIDWVPFAVPSLPLIPLKGEQGDSPHLTFYKRNRLEAAGLLIAEKATMPLTKKRAPSIFFIQAGPSILVLRRTARAAAPKVPVYLLTEAGNELAPFVEAVWDDVMHPWLIALLGRNSFEVFKANKEPQHVIINKLTRGLLGKVAKPPPEPKAK